MKVIVMGRIIGTASGWDQVTDEGMQFYDFEPATGITVPMDTDSIYVDLCYGNIDFYNHDGTVVLESKDCIELMKYIKPSTKEELTE